MIKSLLKPLLTLFWPVGLTKPLTDEGQKDLKACIKHWKNNVHAEPSANPRDVEIRKQNWETVGPHFKRYAIRWGGTFVVLVCITLIGGETTNADLTGVFGIVVFWLTWFSAALTAIHSRAYIKYLEFKRGKEVWK